MLIPTYRNKKRRVFDSLFLFYKIIINILKFFYIKLNDKLVIIDEGNVKDIYRKLANKIITIEELAKESL